MKNAILVRYGEIALKSDHVRRRFEKRLINNIKSGLRENKIEFKIEKEWGRIFISSEKIQKTSKILKRIFGIVSFSPCRVTDAEIGKISRLSVDIAKKTLKQKDTFAVKTRRIGKHSFTSNDINEKIGSAIQKKTRARVNLSKPKKTIFIEIRDKKAYIYTQKISGPGGFPLGTQKRVLGLIENKDGFLASWFVMKRGCCIIPVFSGNIKNKNMLKKWFIGVPFRYYILKSKDKYKELNRIIEKENAMGLVTADSIKEIKKFKTVKQKIRVPVFRPLIGYFFNYKSNNNHGKSNKNNK